MEPMEQTNWEQEHPKHIPEPELFDRATRRIDEALRTVSEIEQRLTRDRAPGSGAG